MKQIQLKLNTPVKIYCLGFFLLGCVADNNVEESIIHEHVVKNTQVFLSAEDTPFLARPTEIKAVSDGLYFVDVGHYQITKVDKEGNHLLSFGNRGRGPGEFQSIAGFWPLADRYLVYDYNSFKFVTFDLNGEITDEEILEKNPVNPESGRSIPITVEVLPSGKLLIPTGGSEGSLFAIAEPSGGNVIYAGTALGEFIARYDNEEVMQAFSRGEIPGLFKNLVMIGVSSSAIYSLQQTTGILEKYTHAGEQVWELELSIPGQEGLMDHIAQHNIETVRSNEPTQTFMYARAMDASEEGVAMLLNMPEDHPVTVAWIPDDGSRIDLVEIEGLKMDVQGFMEGFTVSPDDQRAYYLERGMGTIYQIEWPFRVNRF